MSSNVIPYTIDQPLRWTDIAYKAYGEITTDAIDQLLRANPDLPISAVIPDGTIINVPIIQQNTFVNNASLPPWKQQ